MALTKTQAIIEIDAWAVIQETVLREGAAYDVSGSYGSLLYIEVALIEAAAIDSCTVIVEVSYADDDWMKLTELSGTAETPATEKINDAGNPAAGSVSIELDAGGADFNVVGRKWFIKDTVDIEQSESVRTKSVAGAVITLCQDTMRQHNDNCDCYDRVIEFPPVSIPFEASWVRVLVINNDAANDIASTTRISKVTAMT